MSQAEMIAGSVIWEQTFDSGLGIAVARRHELRDRGTSESVVANGDQARFRNVVLPHLADAYALARWLTGNATDAQDVVQEACLRAFRGIGGFAGGNARAWVLTITRHAAYTWLSKNRSPALVVVDDLEEAERKELSRGTPLEGAETPEAALIAKALGTASNV